MTHSRFFSVLVGACLLFHDSAKADTQVFFSSQQSVEVQLLRLIEASRFSIDLALFQFSSRPLAEAIRRARERGVQVRAILDGHRESDQAGVDAGIAFSSGELRRLDGKSGKGRGIMHHKFALFDHARVITGSFNWTSGAEYVNYENALLVDDAATVASFDREFETMWGRGDPDTPVRPDLASISHAEKTMHPSKRIRLPISKPVSRKSVRRRRARRRHAPAK